MSNSIVKTHPEVIKFWDKNKNEAEKYIDKLLKEKNKK